MSIENSNITITTRAPGKIILSGEHSVVYGKPALAMAVNHFVDITLTQSSDDKIYFEYSRTKLKSVTTLTELRSLQTKIAKHYQDFLEGKREIKDVIHQPLELVQYAFIYLMDHLALSIHGGLKIQVQLNLPVGCGMGASAAVILGLMHAMTNYFDRPLVIDKYLHFGKEIEDLQHGKSSGLDLFLSLYGGCHLFIDGNVSNRNPPTMPMVLVNSGKSQTATGECVTAVAQHFQKTNIADDFTAVTLMMDQALQQNNLLTVQECVRENHRLLKHIGVVPERVANFIATIEELGNAAKISGAGAIDGSNAGIVLVVGEVPVIDIANEYGYEILPIEGELSGLRVV